MKPAGAAPLEDLIVIDGRVTPATVLTARKGGSSVRTARGLGGDSLIVSLMLCRKVDTAGQAWTLSCVELHEYYQKRAEDWEIDGRGFPAGQGAKRDGLISTFTTFTSPGKGTQRGWCDSLFIDNSSYSITNAAPSAGTDLNHWTPGCEAKAWTMSEAVPLPRRGLFSQLASPMMSLPVLDS